MKEPITEQSVHDSWAKYGDGTELRPGFAEWLAGFLNAPVQIEVVHEGTQRLEDVHYVAEFRIREREQ